MEKNTLAGWSLVIAFCALLVSVGAAIYTRKQYNLAYEQDQRALRLKKPVLDVIAQAKDGRHWILTVTIANRSDDRILPIGFEIPSPEGGFIKMKQIWPSGEPIADPTMNHEVKWDIPGRAIPAADTGRWTAEYEISDAFAAKPDVALTLRAKIKYLGAEERDDALTVVRRLNFGS